MFGRNILEKPLGRVLSVTALEKTANATFISSKGIETGLTEAGRAVTKHPQLFGYESTEALRQVVRTDAALNQLGREGIKNILQNGRFGIEYSVGLKTYNAVFRLPNGNGAWCGFNGEFVGFLTPRL